MLHMYELLCSLAFVLAAGLPALGSEPASVQDLGTPIPWRDLGSCGVPSSKGAVKIGDEVFPIALRVPKLESDEDPAGEAVKVPGRDAISEFGTVAYAEMLSYDGKVVMYKWNAPKALFLVDSAGVRRKFTIGLLDGKTVRAGFIVFGSTQTPWPLTEPGARIGKQLTNASPITALLHMEGAVFDMVPVTNPVLLTNAVFETGKSFLHVRPGSVIATSTALSVCEGTLQGSATVTSEGLQLSPGSKFSR